jgi:type I restriction enzyme M protein
MSSANKPNGNGEPKPFPVPDGLRSEEDVKIKFLVPFLAHNGYKADCIDFNKPIEIHEGRKQKTIFADAVVYTTSAKTAPLVVCETKPPTEPLTNSDKEQAISYARLMDRIAPLVLLTNGAQTRVFQSLSKNRIGALPNRKDLKDDFVKFVVSAEVQAALRTEAKHELFIIDDVQSFKTILRACHDEIRNNDGFDATKSFDELSKVLFCKMH